MANKSSSSAKMICFIACRIAQGVMLLCNPVQFLRRFCSCVLWVDGHGYREACVHLKLLYIERPNGVVFSCFFSGW